MTPAIKTLARVTSRRRVVATVRTSRREELCAGFFFRVTKSFPGVDFLRPILVLVGAADYETLGQMGGLSLEILG